MPTKSDHVISNMLGECLFYLAPGGNVWWPVKVGQDGMVEFPFNSQKFLLADCPGKFSFSPNSAAALRAIPSKKRAQASRDNGRKGGRPRKGVK